MSGLIKVTYVGSFDAVEIEHPVGAMLAVKQGETVELPARIAGTPPDGDEPGTGLLAQADNWRPAQAAKPKTTPKDGD